MRQINILKAAIEKDFEIDQKKQFSELVNEAEIFLLNAWPDERHECDVKSLGNHGQRVDFGSFWSQGEIVNFSDHWHKDPATEIDHENFIDDDGKHIQLYYVVGETDYNAPDGYYFDKKQGKHVKADN